MKKFILTPIDVSDQRWDISDRKIPFEVDAVSESEARSIASGEFSGMYDHEGLGGSNPTCPWMNPSMTVCVCVEDV
jgi:hypothetical protein